MLGFGLPGGLRLDARTAFQLTVSAADHGLEPVLLTEVSGFDALALSTALAAVRPRAATGTGIVPLDARSAAATAMAARTAAELSKRPYLLGVGVSTRQIVAQWHRVPHDPSLTTTAARLKELRGLLVGERRGPFALPAVGEADVRVLLGCMGPRMTALGLQHAHGVILNHTPPTHFPAAPADRAVYAYCWVLACEDGVARARRELTSYIMADPYARHFTRLGFGEAVAEVHRLHTEGRLREAPTMLPAELVDALYVHPDALTERVEAFRRAGASPVLMPVTGERPAEELAALLAARPWEP